MKARLEPVLEWHRHEELLTYIDLLNKIEKDIDAPLDASVVEAWMTDARNAVERLEISLLNLMLDIGESLTDEQIAEFKDSLMDKQAEYREEYLERSDKDYADDNYKSLLKNLRRFTGRLNDNQKQVLRQTASSMQRFDIPWLEDRDAWLVKLHRLLQRQAGWKQAILEAHQGREANRPAGYKETADHNIRVIAAGIANVLNSLDGKQLKRVKKEIATYRRDFTRLSNAPGAENTRESQYGT